MASEASGSTPRKRPAKAPVAKAAPKAKVPATDELVLDTLRTVRTAMAANTKATDRLTDSLDRTDQTNTDTIRWRRWATVVGAVAIVAVVVALVVGVLLFLRYRADTEDRRIDGCRQRNAGQVYTRDANEAQNDAVQDLGASAKVMAALRASEAAAPPDIDCDRDGRLTTADYPPAPVP